MWTPSGTLDRMHAHANARRRCGSDPTWPVPRRRLTPPATGRAKFDVSGRAPPLSRLREFLSKYAARSAEIASFSAKPGCSFAREADSGFLASVNYSPKKPCISAVLAQLGGLPQRAPPPGTGNSDRPRDALCALPYAPKSTPRSVLEALRRVLAPRREMKFGIAKTA